MKDHPASPWTAAHRAAFRFTFSYLVLFFFPFPQGLVKPFWLGDLQSPIWERLVPWFALTVIHVELPPTSSGSGDSVFEYVRVLLMVLIAGAATVVWSVLDRGRPDYRTLRAWSRIWLRYALALCMLTFGVVKVVMLQFEPPGVGRLAQPLGELSPMAFLWTFMGFSKAYTCFTGITEVLGGALLLFRRTTTLGALVVAGVMTNVVMLNISYDVCVKLGSMHILLLALILLAPDAARLVNFFVLNRPAAPAELEPPWRGRSLIAARCLKAGVILWALGYFAWDAAAAYRSQTSARDPEPVAPEGAYRVESVKRDDQPVPPLKPEDLLWKSISLRKGVLSVGGKDGSSQRYKIEGDARLGPVNLLEVNDKGEPLPGDPIGTVTLTFSGDGTTAELTGTFKGHTVEAALRRRNAGDYPLMNRPFRWIINEPYFR